MTDSFEEKEDKKEITEDNEEENVESPRIKYLTQEYDVKKTNSTNYNDPAMQYYPGWNWKQKREQAVLKLNIIMKRFASAIVEKNLKQMSLEVVQRSLAS